MSHFQQPTKYRRYVGKIEGGEFSYCESWAMSHEPALATSLASQRISEILSSIGTDGKQTFLAKWIGKVQEDDYICYDITSVSSYSELAISFHLLSIYMNFHIAYAQKTSCILST
jgi:hypothetical protein